MGCNVWKPDRTHHCSICNRCILNMDHHCPWINNCVGFYNRKFFIQLLLYAYVTLIIVCSASLYDFGDRCWWLRQSKMQIWDWYQCVLATAVVGMSDLLSCLL